MILGNKAGKKKIPEVYPSIFMVNKKVSGVILHRVADLKAVSMSYLLRLEGCIQALHRNSSLWSLRFLKSTDSA